MRRLTALAFAAVLPLGPLAAQTDAPLEDQPVVAQPEAAEASGPLTVALAPSASVVADQITLADVAELPEASPLAEVWLAASPLPGGQRVLTRGQVELRLVRAGWDEGVALGGADSVVVTRTSTKLPATDIRAAAAELLPLDVVVERIPPRRPLPAGEVSYRLRTGLTGELPERFSVDIDVLVDGRVADRLSIGVRRTDLPPAPAARSTAPAAPVAPAAPAAPLAAAEAPAPEPAAPVRPAWEVKRGDAVTITIVSGAIKVSIAAEALGSGTLGDVVQFRTTINRRSQTLAATLIAPDRAVMEL